MSTKRELVYKLDESMAFSGVPKIIHLVFRDGLPWGRFREKDLFLAGCSPGLSASKSSANWPEWYRQIDSNAGHSCESFNTSTPGGHEAEALNGKEHQGSDPSGLGRCSEVDHPSERTSEPVQQGEVQRGDDTIFHRPPGLGPGTSTYQIRWEHGDSAPRVLCDGRLDETVVTRYAPEHGGGRWLSTTIFNCERGLQI